MNHEHDREEIIVANPLLEYCQAQGWQLKKDGSSRWTCLCPLHDETTPSFTIDPRKNLWKCFGCDTGGSVIDLHAKLRGTSIGEAMRDLTPGGSRNGSAGSSATKALPERKNATVAKSALESTNRPSLMLTTTRTQLVKSSSKLFATSRRPSSNAGSLTANESGTWRASNAYPTPAAPSAFDDLN